jgi:hypothetical protein
MTMVIIRKEPKMARDQATIMMTEAENNNKKKCFRPTLPTWKKRAISTYVKRGTLLAEQSRDCQAGRRFGKHKPGPSAPSCPERSRKCTG